MKFIVEAKDISVGLSKIKDIISLAKKNEHILLKAKDGVLQLCYSDGKHATVHKANIMADNLAEIDFTYVINFDRFVTIISNCSESAEIKVRPLTITIDENNTMQIFSTKYIMLRSEVGEDETDVTDIDFSIRLENVNSSMAFGLLTRMNYDDIFNYEVADVWDRQELINALKSLKQDDVKTVYYFSSQDKVAKSRGRQYGVFVEVPSVTNFGFAITAPTAIALQGVLSKMEGETVNLHVTNTIFVNVTNSESTFGFWFEMGKGSTVDNSSFELFKNSDISDIMMKIHRNAFISALNALNSVSGSEKSKIKITETDGKYELNIINTVSGSMVNNMSIALNAIRTREGESIDVAAFSTVVIIGSIKEILNKCIGDWIMLDVNFNSRLAKIVDVYHNGDQYVSGAQFYITVTEE